MTGLRERIEAERAALLGERAIAEAATPGPWVSVLHRVEIAPDVRPGVVLTVARVSATTGRYQSEERNRDHIARQDPAATIARIDRELARIDADLALLDSAVPYLESWGWRDVAANLNARYPEVTA